MLDFLTSYGIEILLILYGIINTFFNVILFRRTGKLSHTSKSVKTDSTCSDKLVSKIHKARDKLEKLITKAVESEQLSDSVLGDKTNGSSE